MKSLQEISDRMEIEELFIRYAYAIDDRRLDELDNVFLPGGTFDMTAFGGPRSTWPEVKQWLANALGNYAGYQHIPVSSLIEVKGDEAFARTVCFNPMIARDDGALGVDMFFIGLWYRDHLIRTPAGWRIRERAEQRSWIFNAHPGNMPPTPPFAG